MKSNNNNRNLMTNEELIATIRAEIEKEYNESHNKKIIAHRDKDYYNEIAYCAVMDAYNRFLSFLSNLEKSLPTEVTDGEELEKEIEGYFPESAFDTGWNYDDMQEVAHHFYELGCHRTAEKYDEIEYNRQKAEEQGSKGLEEEIIKCWQEWVSPSNKQSVEGVLPLSEFAFYARHFAQWGAEHLKK